LGEYEDSTGGREQHEAGMDIITVETLGKECEVEFVLTSEPADGGLEFRDNNYFKYSREEYEHTLG